AADDDVIVGHFPPRLCPVLRPDCRPAARGGQPRCHPPGAQSGGHRSFPHDDIYDGAGTQTLYRRFTTRADGNQATADAADEGKGRSSMVNKIKLLAIAATLAVVGTS